MSERNRSKFLLVYDNPDLPEQYFNDREARDSHLKQMIDEDDSIVAYAIVDTESPNAKVQEFRLLKMMSVITEEHFK